MISRRKEPVEALRRGSLESPDHVATSWAPQVVTPCSMALEKQEEANRRRGLEVGEGQAVVYNPEECVSPSS